MNTNVRTTARVLLAFAFALGIVGCANSPKEALDQLRAAKQYESTQQAIRSAKAAAVLVLGEEFVSSLESSDSVVKVGTELSSFKVFAFTVAEAVPTEIRLEAFCNCLGGEKSVPIPFILVANEAGEAVESKLTNQAVLEPSFARPLRLASIWSLPRLPSGKYRLMLAADNNRNDKEVLRTPGGGIVFFGGVAVPANYAMSIRSHPHGKVSVRIQ